MPTRPERAKIPSTARDRAAGPQRAAASYFTDMTRRRHPHPGARRPASAARGALAVALPLTDVDHALSSQLLLLMRDRRRRDPARRRCSGSLVARTALAPIARFTRQTESIAATPSGSSTSASTSTAATSWPGWPRRSTARSMRWSARCRPSATWSPTPRTSCARRSPPIRANLQLMRDEELLSPEDREALRARRDRGARRADRAGRRRRRARPRRQAVAASRATSGSTRSSPPRSSGRAAAAPQLTVRPGRGADAGARRGRPDRPGGDQPARQRRQVEPARRRRRGRRCTTAR